MMRVLSKLCLVQHDRFDALALAASPNWLEAALDAAPCFLTAEKPNDHVELPVFGFARNAGWHAPRVAREARFPAHGSRKRLAVALDVLIDGTWRMAG